MHRDLKPQNILLSDANARISDFGMAKNFQQAGLSGMSLTGTAVLAHIAMSPVNYVVELGNGCDGFDAVCLTMALCSP